MDCIRCDYIHRLMDRLPLALRLSNVGRDDHSAILDAVRGLLASSEAREALREGFESQDRFVRRFCFQLALNSNEADLLTVLQRAFVERDAQVRKEAVYKLHAILPSGGSKELLIRARNDGCMAVRREALHIFAEKYADEADQEFQSALLDANIAGREEAQYYFQKKGTVDLRAYYSHRLETSNSRQLCAAIAGVGQCVAALLKNEKLDAEDEDILGKLERIRWNAQTFTGKGNEMMDAVRMGFGQKVGQLCRKHPNIALALLFPDLTTGTTTLYGCEKYSRQRASSSPPPVRPPRAPNGPSKPK
jgi:hypothetical protein